MTLSIGRKVFLIMNHKSVASDRPFGPTLAPGTGLQTHTTHLGIPLHLEKYFKSDCQNRVFEFTVVLQL